jgi:sugar phosphate isomerase/epimerase
MTDLLIGLQIYTVRSRMSADPEGTLRQLAEMGYGGLEAAGGPAGLPLSTKPLLDELRLPVFGVHTGLPQLEDDFEATLEYCRGLGAEYVTIAHTSPEVHRNVAGLAERLNTLGHRLRQEGMTLSYHNHAMELEKFDGTTVLDGLLKATDPDVVMAEFDVGWVKAGGADPVEYLRRYAGRIPFVHMKDMTRDGEPVDVGDGVLDMPAILRAAVEGGTHYLIAENDNPPDPMESARRSLEALQALTAGQR